MKRILITITILAALPLLSYAKTEPKPPAPTVQPAAPAPPAVSPKLSYAEELALQALASEERTDQQALQGVFQKERLLVQDIQRNHPGYTFDPGSGQLAPAPSKKPSTPPAKR